jgi:hypothetical protein
MTVSLSWYKPSNELTLVDGGSAWLKQILARRYLNHDGSLKGVFELSHDDDHEYLQGLVDAGVETAKELIDALELHGRLLLKIE